MIAAIFMYTLKKFKNIFRCSLGDQRGQLLIESLFALALVSATLVSVVSLLISAVRISGVNHRKAIASNVAREAIESIRSLRDNEADSASLFASTSETRFFRLLYHFPEEDDPTARWELEETYLADPLDDLYAIVYDPATRISRPVEDMEVMPDPSESKGIFYRHISIGPAEGTSNPDKKTVQVRVSFIEKGDSRSVVYSTTLTNWKRDYQ